MQSGSVGVGAPSGLDWMEADQAIPAPPYSQDPVIPYPVATLGRLVLPPGGLTEPSSSRTLPAVLRRMRRRSANSRAETQNEASDEAIRQSRDLNAVLWTRMTDCAIAGTPHRGESLGNGGEEDGENGGGGHPDRCACSAGDESQYSNRGTALVTPTQQLQRYSYLSQSDFLPGAVCECSDRIHLVPYA
jgi:hypothetical protein